MNVTSPWDSHLHILISHSAHQLSQIPKEEHTPRCSDSLDCYPSAKGHHDLVNQTDVWYSYPVSWVVCVTVASQGMCCITHNTSLLYCIVTHWGTLLKHFFTKTALQIRQGLLICGRLGPLYSSDGNLCKQRRQVFVSFFVSFDSFYDISFILM